MFCDTHLESVLAQENGTDYRRGRPWMALNETLDAFGRPKF